MVQFIDPGKSELHLKRKKGRKRGKGGKKSSRRGKRVKCDEKYKKKGENMLVCSGGQKDFSRECRGNDFNVKYLPLAVPENVQCG